MRQLVGWSIWVIVMVICHVSIIIIMTTFHICTWSQLVFSLVSGIVSYTLGLPLAFCARKGYLNWLNEQIKRRG